MIAVFLPYSWCLLADADVHDQAGARSGLSDPQRMKTCSPMKHPGLITVLLGFVACLALGRAEESPAISLRAMTFNLRYASDQAPNAWPVRRPVMRQILAANAPDIIGTQEGVFHQLQDIDQDLPDHDWIGLGRRGGSRDEYCAIFYRRDRFIPIAYDHFWLSDTPEMVGSMTWGNRWVRMVTWVRFQDTATGREFIVLNTHFDHQVEEARQKSAALIVQRLADFDPSLPLIVLGDFNCAAGQSKAFDLLTDGTQLVDTWTAAAHRSPTPAPNTFHGYESPKVEAKRIDWILTRGAQNIDSARIITDSINDQYPSDHFPVVADLQL
jgi:endonuclease/exonuclease/phosphatase family metal-dependent hydrolase